MTQEHIREAWFHSGENWSGWLPIEIAVESFIRRKAFHKRAGSEIKNASVSTKMVFPTLGGKISWRKSFIKPAAIGMIVRLSGAATDRTYGCPQNGLSAGCLHVQCVPTFSGMKVYRTAHESDTVVASLDPNGLAGSFQPHRRRRCGCRPVDWCAS